MMNIKKSFLILSSLLSVFCISLNAALYPFHSSYERTFQEEIEDHILISRTTVQEYSANNADVLKMFDSLVTQWCSYYNTHQRTFPLPILLKAISFAATKYEGKTCKDVAATPYIIYPLEVAYSLWEEAKIRSSNVLIAALLHETPKYTRTTIDEIDTYFGSRVCYAVKELAYDPCLSTKANKQLQVDRSPLLSLDAQLVRLADCLHHVRDLDHLPLQQKEEARAYNLKWGKKFLLALAGANETLEQALANELESIPFNQL